MGALWTQMLMTGNSELSLYIHIPFCKKKCPYCHFYSIASREDLFEKYLQALLIEINLRKEEIKKSSLVSLYFGGGTPFLFTPARIEKILDAISCINAVPALEITLEANPETVTQDSFHAYACAGINRVSFGVQSFNIDELRFLGRDHSLEQVFNAIDFAIKAGISNISIDLMYELPQQTVDSWVHSLDTALHLPITHLSLYNLMIEEPSAFFRKKEKIEQNMPDPEISKRMYDILLEKTFATGFLQYEISAFAKKGFASKHNLGYWQGRSFLGFGPSAFSFYENKRFSNIANIQTYCSELSREIIPIDFIDQVSSEERQRELLAVGLRMNEGINLDAFQKKWGMFDASLNETLSWLKSITLLTEENSLLKLTDRGRLLYDHVASEII